MSLTVSAALAAAGCAVLAPLWGTGDRFMLAAPSRPGSDTWQREYPMESIVSIVLIELVVYIDIAAWNDFDFIRREGTPTW
jgi:hypothetical protein